MCLNHRRRLRVRVWSASASRAAELDPYAGLLVSLHVMAPVVHRGDASRPPVRRRASAVRDEQIPTSRDRAAGIVAKSLGLHIDRPLRHGLAEEGIDPAEDALRFDFRWLQAFDQLSLAVCCNDPPLGKTIEVHPQPGKPPITLRTRCLSSSELTVEPWPFVSRVIETSVPAKRLPRRRYDDVETFRARVRRSARSKRCDSRSFKK